MPDPIREAAANFAFAEQLFTVTQVPVPASSLLRVYRDGPDPVAWDEFSDCFVVTIDGQVSLSEFVFAFYTSPVFKLERLILRLVKLPSTDEDARQLAEGERDTFAAWQVVQRTETQLLLCDVFGRTRSWLAVTSPPMGGESCTVLQFGSGIAAGINVATGRRKKSLGFRLLGRFHTVYSRVLLSAAKGRLQRAWRKR